MGYNKLNREEKWIILGVPILFLIGSFFHFLYELSGKNSIVALFAPVNESVWEHIKMLVVPLVLWWFIYYLVRGKQLNIDKNKWFTSALISLLVAIISIPLMFYFYTGALGFESVIIDILLLFLALLFGQLTGLHYYRYGDGINYFASIFFIVIIICVFMYFTYNTPHLPIFMDSNTGQYGVLIIETE